MDIEKVLPDEKDLFETRLAELERSFPHTRLEGSGSSSIQAGEIRNLMASHEKHPLLLDTGRAVILPLERDVFLPKLGMCWGFFCFSCQSKTAMHMSFQGPLSYTGPNLSSSLLKLRSGLLQEAINLSDVKNFLVINFTHQHQEAFQNDMVKAFQQQLETRGFPQAQIIRLPLDNSTIYHSGHEPDILASMGYVTNFDSQGNLQFTKKIKKYFISLGTENSKNPISAIQEGSRNNWEFVQAMHHPSSL